MGGAKRLIKLRSGQVAGAEQEVIAPLAAMMFDVHESDAGAGGKAEGRHAGAIDVDGQIHEGRTVGLLMCGHSQRGYAILGKAFVAQAVELAFYKDTRIFPNSPSPATRVSWVSSFGRSSGPCVSDFRLCSSL